MREDALRDPAAAAHGPGADQPADRPGRENFIDDFRQVGSFGAGGQSSGSAAPSQAPAQKFT